jgi:hypothetical protein
MSTQQNQVPQNTEKLKEIPKWTRKYAQNRTVPFLVSMAIFLLLFTAIFGLSYLAGKANQSANVPVLLICIFVVTVAMISLAFFCVPKWGGKFIEHISRRLYNREGNVLISVPETIKKKQWIGYVVAMVFVSCVFISVILGLLGYLSIKYMQPVSALYVVPFLVFLYLWQRPIISPLALLWPTLYTIHAILVVAGVPIQFGGPLVFLNMLIPIAGYGILCGLLGHLYSRYALKKLKTAAHLQENTNEQ